MSDASCRLEGTASRRSSRREGRASLLGKLPACPGRAATRTRVRGARHHARNVSFHDATRRFASCAALPGAFGSRARAGRTAPPGPHTAMPSCSAVPSLGSTSARSPKGHERLAVIRRSCTCNPLVKEQHPGFAVACRTGREPGPGGFRASRRSTHFDSLDHPARRRSLLGRVGSRESLTLLETRAAGLATTTARAPTPRPAGSARERETHGPEPGAPSADEGRREASRPRVTARAAAPVHRGEPKPTTARPTRPSTAATAPRLPGPGNHAPTSAIDAKPEHAGG